MSRSRAVLLVALAVAAAVLVVWTQTSGVKGIYVSPRFFGQHLMFFSSLNPAIPVHAMRLGSSNTDWCEMDNGTASNEYNFAQLDALLAQAGRVHADVDFMFASTPQWAATGSYPQLAIVNQCGWGTSTNRPPANESYWTNFVRAVVTHAKGRIHAYELWNEVDTPSFWTGSMAQMVKMTIDAAAIIHHVDHSAVVLSPSVTDSAEGYSYLKQLLSNLPAGTVDAIAVHSYTGRTWPEQSVPAEMRSVRATLPSSLRTIPIWSTEGSWGLNSWFSTLGSDQAAFVARYDLMMLNQRFARSYWYAYPNTQWGTLWDGTALTPAGVASNTIYTWLSGARFLGCFTRNSNVWTCSLTTSGGKKAKIVWVTAAAVWYSTAGYRTVDTLDGRSSHAPGWIQAGLQPVLLST